MRKEATRVVFLPNCEDVYAQYRGLKFLVEGVCFGVCSHRPNAGVYLHLKEVFVAFKAINHVEVSNLAALDCVCEKGLICSGGEDEHRFMDDEWIREGKLVCYGHGDANIIVESVETRQLPEGHH